MQSSREADILISEHEPGLRAFVVACVRDRQATDDLVQETFLAAWASLDQYDESRPFAAWLRGIARHKVNTYFESVAARRQREQLLMPAQVEAIDAEFARLVPRRGDSLEAALAALRDCMTGLSAEERDVVERAYRSEPQTCGAIATKLGATVEAIKKRLQRARLRLHECITSKVRAEDAGV